MNLRAREDLLLLQEASRRLLEGIHERRATLCVGTREEVAAEEHGYEEVIAGVSTPDAEDALYPVLTRSKALRSTCVALVPFTPPRDGASLHSRPTPLHRCVPRTLVCF